MASTTIATIVLLAVIRKFNVTRFFIIRLEQIWSICTLERYISATNRVNVTSRPCIVLKINIIINANLLLRIFVNRIVKLVLLGGRFLESVTNALDLCYFMQKYRERKLATMYY